MHPVFLLSAAAILLSPSIAGVPTPAPTQGTGVDYDGSCGPGTTDDPWTCMFVVIITDPAIIFFRWDFSGDGVWDTPWVTDAVIYYRNDRAGAFNICLQAWNGVSMEGGQPVGPLVCHTWVLSFDLYPSPDTWDRTSTGRVILTWDVPLAFAPATPRAQWAKIGDVPLKVGFTFLGRGTEPILAYFYADRAALTSALGPGTHLVLLWGEWGGARLRVVGQVTIL